jgi:hypothetical protein
MDTSGTTVSSTLFEKGIEDILSLDSNLDLLLMKMHKILDQSARKAALSATASEETSGARGRLADMSLIDLIQALGPSQKTVRITIKSNHQPGTPLAIFLDRGRIVNARLGELGGAEAVYRALSWTDGTWIIEPLPPEKLPEPNNDLSNESILMEGCRLMDESIRRGQLFCENTGGQ